MASLTGRTRKIRLRKRTKQGAERKKRAQKHGTTPKFAVHPEGKDEQKA